MLLQSLFSDTERWMVMGMYESPIKIIESTIDSIYKDIVKKKDDAIFAEIQSSFGVDVDREELIRALRYDREQYEKGYADGRNDAMGDLVCCKNCKNNGQCSIQDAMNWIPKINIGDSFCSYGERREGE